MKMKYYQLYTISKQTNGRWVSNIFERRAMSSGGAIAAEAKNWEDEHLRLVFVTDFNTNPIAFEMLFPLKTRLDKRYEHLFNQND